MRMRTTSPAPASPAVGQFGQLAAPQPLGNGVEPQYLLPPIARFCCLRLLLLLLVVPLLLLLDCRCIRIHLLLLV
jgi:hypothetical protein